MALVSTVKTRARYQGLFSEIQHPDQSQENTSKIHIIYILENTQDVQQKYLNLGNTRYESLNLIIFSDDNHSKEVGDTPYKVPHQPAKHSYLKIPAWYALLFSKTQSPLPNMTLIQTNSRIQTAHNHLFDTKPLHLRGNLAKRLDELEQKTEGVALAHVTFSRNTRTQLKQILALSQHKIRPINQLQQSGSHKTLRAASAALVFLY